MAVSDDEILSYFHRHLVPVLFGFVKGENRHRMVVTAFVLSVSDQWFLVTAGHCLKLVERMTTEQGYSLEACYLIDTLGSEARNFLPIPFAYGKAEPICMSDDLDFDYGLIRLDPYYRELLARNGVVALDEEVWQKQPAAVDFHVLLGFPTELIEDQPTEVALGSALLMVQEVSEKPSGFSGGQMPLFYGRLDLRHALRSIEGMSGGPIFAFRQNERGELRYWVTALQSRWLPQSQIVAACPTLFLGETIALALQRYAESVEDLNAGKDAS